MTDKLFQNEHEIQEMIDADNKVKEDIIAKHNEDIKVMDSLIYSLNNMYNFLIGSYFGLRLKSLNCIIIFFTSSCLSFLFL